MGFLVQFYPWRDWCFLAPNVNKLSVTKGVSNFSFFTRHVSTFSVLRDIRTSLLNVLQFTSRTIRKPLLFQNNPLLKAVKDFPKFPKVTKLPPDGCDSEYLTFPKSLQTLLNTSRVVPLLKVAELIVITSHCYHSSR